MTFPESLKDAMRQMIRNNRWGTCVSCPRTSEGHAITEACVNTKNPDHQLTMEMLFEQYRNATGHD